MSIKNVYIYGKSQHFSQKPITIMNIQFRIHSFSSFGSSDQDKRLLYEDH